MTLNQEIPAKVYSNTMASKLTLRRQITLLGVSLIFTLGKLTRGVFVEK